MLKLVMMIPDARHNPQPLPPPTPPPPPFPHGEASRPEYVTSLRDDTSWSAADGVAAESSQRPARCWIEKQQGTCVYDFKDTDRTVWTFLGAEIWFATGIIEVVWWELLQKIEHENSNTREKILTVYHGRCITL